MYSINYIILKNLVGELMYRLEDIAEASYIKNVDFVNSEQMVYIKILKFMQQRDPDNVLEIDSDLEKKYPYIEK